MMTRAGRPGQSEREHFLPHFFDLPGFDIALFGVFADRVLQSVLPFAAAVAQLLVDTVD